MANAKRIDLENVDKDKYFRILADVVADGRSVKDVLEKTISHMRMKVRPNKKLNWCKRLPASNNN